MKVILYARASTTQQQPENQLVALREVAERNKWEIINEYVDLGISGAKGRDKRPQFDAMLKSAMRKEADQLILWRSEEHTSELQSPCKLVCSLLLEKNI